MPDLLIERLRKHQRQRGDVSPFASHTEFLAWSDSVLPLLSFNSVLQNEFKSAVRASNINISAEGRLSNVNRAIGVVNQAIVSLEIVPVPNAASDPAPKISNDPSDWHEKPLGKIFLGLCIALIGSAALWAIGHYFS